MKAPLSPATTLAYATCSKLFEIATRHRNRPDASRCQAELTRGGARIGASLELTSKNMAELGISIELADKHAATHAYWIRVAVVDSSPNGQARLPTSIVIPALDHRGCVFETQAVGFHEGALDA